MNTRTDIDPSAFERCAALLAEADGLLVTAGAGMGVDSGLPDFRGTAGFWRAYPALARAQVHFEDIANPRAFAADPRLAWGFYGHRLALYRTTLPHAGFRLLQTFAAQMPNGAFVYTSNVDGQFQKAAWPTLRIVECHGSIHHLQCVRACTDSVWPADAFMPLVDEETGRLQNAPPSCPHCGGLARPNILMFGDMLWVESRSASQAHRLDVWMSRAERGVVIELGAGTAIPTVRLAGENSGWPIIRINPREPKLGDERGVSLPTGALAALEGIAETLNLSI